MMSTLTKSRNKLGLFMADFDNTCNMRDTCELFYQASLKYQSGTAEDRALLDRTWKEVTGKYLKEYNEQISKSLARFSNKKPSDFDQEGLLSFLQDIAKFNTEATRDVDKSNLILGVDNAGLQSIARRVKLYPGCFDVLKSILQNVRIVSVNWSAELIAYSFDEMIPKKHIYANHILGNDGLANGLVGKEMISSFDKLKIVQQILAKDKGVSVFVGDSITDLLGLLEADIGIIIGDSKTILKTADTFGINVEPIAEILKPKELDFSCGRASNRTRVLYITKDWYQIEQLVRKLS